jgi:hypothetical protein
MGWFRKLLGKNGDEYPPSISRDVPLPEVQPEDIGVNFVNSDILYYSYVNDNVSDYRTLKGKQYKYDHVFSVVDKETNMFRMANLYTIPLFFKIGNKYVQFKITQNGREIVNTFDELPALHMLVNDVPKEWIQKNDAEDEWFENTTTGESVWVIPPGTVVAQQGGSRRKNRKSRRKTRSKTHRKLRKSTKRR